MQAMIYGQKRSSALLCVVLGAWVGTAAAVSPADYAVRVSAVAQANPPQLTLSWPADPTASSCTLYRKLRDDDSWGAAISLPANATNYVDANVVAGGAYEYQIYRVAPQYSSYGYIYTGGVITLVESRGRVVLIVDSTHTAALSHELARLEQDLAGDGWTVVRHDVSRTDSVAAVKGLIQADYNADTNSLRAVFLFGHVPVPYSGDMYPDGHGGLDGFPNHRGAWPADAYYGDMDGTWTDSSVNNSGAADPRNRNIPGDGKFDHTRLPSLVELQVGRVDLADLPAFNLSETELLRRYLNKDHAFRHKLFNADRRALIDDKLGLATGEPFGASGWRNFSVFFGASNTFTGNWLNTLNSQSYLWGQAVSYGDYTWCLNITTTSQLAVSDPRVVFTMFYGSYFGDWDSQNNVMRAVLATPTYTLTSAWVGRPAWQFHHMALGETIGFSTRVNQNNFLYPQGYARFAHVSLLGDPTLRMHVVAPPAALTVATNGVGGVDLSWSAAPDAVLGYHVYRATTAAGPFTRLNPDLIVGTAFTDPEITTNVYMVRAVKLEVSASGSYYNASQGIFQSLDGTTGAPRIALLQPTNGTVFLAPTNLTLAATTFDPANCITNVAFYANGLLVGQAAGSAQTAVWTNAPAGTYSVVAQAKCQHGQVTNSSPAQIMLVGNSPTLTISAIGSGVQGLGDGVPGRVYRIQYLHTLAATNWQTLLTTTSTLAGIFQFTDTGSSTQKFYRAVFP